MANDLSVDLVSNNNQVKIQDGEIAATNTVNSVDVPVGQNEASDKQMEQVTVLKAEDLDYSTFKRKDRVHADEIARRSINEIKDRTRDFNADFPTKPYVPNYKDFPRPEAFKQFGKNAYNSWESAVKEWVEDCKQDMRTLKDKNIQDLANLNKEFARIIQSGFFKVYMDLGMTNKHIEDVYIRLNGNINKVKKVLEAEAKSILDTINNTADIVMENDDYNTSSLHYHIDEDGYQTRKIVRYEAAETRMAVEDEGESTRKTVENEGAETRAEIRKMQQEILSKLEQKPEKRSLVEEIIRTYLKIVVGVPIHIAKEILKLPINILKSILDLFKE